ncbi:MAG: hypothetical protein COA79_08320 [Planctomycetota bacterium]|nr:MAG: hypothetical protein COA79_08320 [Planctomycetota bacterium]
MENEKLRHVVFAVICAFCLVLVFNNAERTKKEAEKNKPIEVDTVTGDKSDKKNSSVKTSENDKQENKEDIKSSDETDKNTKEPVVNKKYSVADTPSEKPKEVIVETKEFKFIFSNEGGTLLKLNLHNYKATYKKDSPDYILIKRKKAKWNKMLSVHGFDDVFNNASFNMKLDETGKGPVLTMNCIRNGIEIIKTIELKKESFDFQFKIKVINHREKEIKNDLRFTAVVNMDFDLNDRNSIMSDQVATLINDGGELISAGDFNWISGTYGARESIHDLTATPFVMGKLRKTKDGKRDGSKVVWGALKNRYFAIIYKPTKDDWTLNGSNVNPTKKDPALNVVPLIEWQASGNKLAPGQSFEENFKVFAGPTKNGVINLPAYEKDMFVDVIDYGFLFPRFLKLFDGLLNFIIKVVGEKQYWLGIILLTLMVRMGMFPITRKSSMSQAKLQKVTPKLKDIREKFKGDNRKIQEETMKLYKVEGVNPFSSCLPMFLQMPIFLGLYWTLMLTFEVRFKQFLWINDLAVADHLFEHGYNIFIIGTYFNLLPLLYSVINYFHMASMPAPQDPMQAQQQKIMRYIFPVMMLMFFYQMPSALVLYFIVSGTWSIVEQKMIKAKIKKMDDTVKK